jgi:S-DNA-T family DNA segregation ATPase FtsK/SpoIIIE
MGKDKKINNKNQSNPRVKNPEATILFFVLGFLLSVYIFIAPDKTGVLGRVFFNVMFGMFGTASYILPLAFLQRFIAIYVRRSSELKKKYYFVWSVACLVSCSMLFEATRFIFAFKVHGGWVGNNLYPFFKELLDVGPSFVIILAVFIFVLSNISGVSFFGRIKPNIVVKQDRKEKEESRELQSIVKQVEIPSKNFNYELPYTSLLENDCNGNFEANHDELLDKAELLGTILSDFGVNAKVKDIVPGPLVTRYDLILAPGVRIQAVSNIIDNISLAMRSASIRIVNIPEKAVVGVEVANSSSVIVGLRGILEDSSFKNSKSLLTLALGKTTERLGYVVNLASMPHLLIAGATGSGKSVGVHTIILSILYKARPDEVKFVLIDPKHVEMSIYKDMPHIYNPCVEAIEASIITDSKEASEVLKKLVIVMNERYARFAKNGVRNIEEYNNKMGVIGGKEFYIVVVIDEFADLMLLVQKEIEDSIQRLSQMARAVGIHLILATQRPSVNVITGVVKANFPARLSFQTTSKIDSRVILDMIGAERLMGKGDMLFLPPGESRPIRLQGAYVSLNETEKIVSFVKEQDFPRMYEQPIVIKAIDKNSPEVSEPKWGKDLIPALKLINSRKRVSQDLLKANFGSSARATNLLSILEIKGFIAKPDGTNKWQINYSKIVEYLENNKN